MPLWVVLVALVIAGNLLWWRRRRDHVRWIQAWDALARNLSLGFDPADRTIRGRYRLLRLEITARRAFLGLGPWRTQLSARYEGVVPEGLRLTLDGAGTLRAAAHQRQALESWLDAHGRRALLGPMLEGGVQVSGSTARVERIGLLTHPEDLRVVLGRLAELAKLLSLR